MRTDGLNDIHVQHVCKLCTIEMNTSVICTANKITNSLRAQKKGEFAHIFIHIYNVHCICIN